MNGILCYSLFQAELSFQTGQIIHVYGEMDDDGFYMAEIDGMRGLVPSNFLTEANDQYGPPGHSGQGLHTKFHKSLKYNVFEYTFLHIGVSSVV